MLVLFLLDLIFLKLKIERFEAILMEDSRLDRIHLRRQHESSQYEILRPGFVRFSLPYFFDDDTVEKVLKAISWTAENGWKMLPHYVFDCETGEWKHSKHLSYSDRRWLGDLRFNSAGVEIKENNVDNKHGTVCSNLSEALADAEKISSNNKVRRQDNDQSTGFQGEAGELRWFLLPSEARDLFKKVIKFENLKKSPFTVRKQIPKIDFSNYKISQSTIENLKNSKSSKMEIKPSQSEVQKNKIENRPEKRKNENGESENSKKENGQNGEQTECTDDVCVPCMMPRKKKARQETPKGQEK